MTLFRMVAAADSLDCDPGAGRPFASGSGVLYWPPAPQSRAACFMLDLFDLPDARTQAQRPLPEPPPDGMSAGQITLHFKNEQPLVVPAYRIGAVAVHRTVA